MLTSPFNFNDFYHRYADSWRVNKGESMLTVCNSENAIESGAPSRTFFATDLEAGLQEKARGTCTGAGVKEGPLLEACTLDVAVIGNGAAANAFVNAIPPAAVGTFLGSGGAADGILMKWWWLLLLLVLGGVWILWLLIRKKA